MDIIDTVQGIQARVSAWKRDGTRIALVPTMGCLHEAHLELIRRARREADAVVVSVFVNPIQFGKGEDLEQYPRDLARDARLCEEVGVEVVFAPGTQSMYAPDHSVYVEETDLSAGLCGAGRPGHFRGVTTVVAKLFNTVQPDVAVFGEKDAQQVAVIQRMVRDLDYPIAIVVVPTVREADGLAMSSRNAYLSTTERRKATGLHRALLAAKHLYEDGQASADALRNCVIETVEREGGIEIEYVSVVAFDSLQPVDTAHGATLLALAVRIGTTRLIDNVLLGAD